MVGNMECLVNSPSNTWREIAEELKQQESIGTVVKIRCPNHKEDIEINAPEEFRQKSPEGGCTKMCPGVLPRCDHSCRNICHGVDTSHELYECKESCERHCPDSKRHKCPHICYIYPCPPCQVEMVRTLLCGHIVSLPCHVDVVKHSCKTLVPKTLKCGHLVDLVCSMPTENHICTIKLNKELECGPTKLLPCHVPVTDYECVQEVTKDLDCGHTGVMKCIDDPTKFICCRPTDRSLPCGHYQTDPCNQDTANIKCVTKLDRVHEDCLHVVEIFCWQRDIPKEWKCFEECDTRLNCGHQCDRKCHTQDDPSHLNYLCRKTCARSCSNDHKCRKRHRCHQACDPCKIKTVKTLSCGHEIQAMCSENEEKLQCQEVCHKILACGHECPKSCYMPCNPCMVSALRISFL